MKNFKYVGMIFLFLLTLVTVQPALADKSAVTITAPEAVAKGTEVTVKLSVTHSGNNRFHYTNWVTLKANDKEVTRWEFTGSKRPEAEVFTREFKIMVNEPLELTAEANCNMHGSKGPAKWKISIK
ncbi:MAG: desulfoferrodoxin family protein [Thermodesulfobacteriota bacterium]